MWHVNNVISTTRLQERQRNVQLVMRIRTFMPGLWGPTAQIAIQPQPGFRRTSIYRTRNLVSMKKGQASIMVTQPAAPVILPQYEVILAWRVIATIRVEKVMSTKGAMIKI